MNLAQLRNVGEQTAGWFATIGIYTVDDLRRGGVVSAYKKVKERFPDRVSLNCLYALEAGLRGVDWRDLPEEEKEQLRKRSISL